MSYSYIKVMNQTKGPDTRAIGKRGGVTHAE